MHIYMSFCGFLSAKQTQVIVAARWKDWERKPEAHMDLKLYILNRMVTSLKCSFIRFWLEKYHYKIQLTTFGFSDSVLEYYKISHSFFWPFSLASFLKF